MSSVKQQSRHDRNIPQEASNFSLSRAGGARAVSRHLPDILTVLVPYWCILQVLLGSDVPVSGGKIILVGRGAGGFTKN